jgi:hypothetical protein
METIMNITTRIRIVTVIGCLLMLSLSVGIDAQEQCNEASLHGSYAFLIDGTVQPNTVGLIPGPFAAVGRATYDGKGGMRGVIVASIGGVSTPLLTDQARFTFEGKYKLNSDCTGSKYATLNIGATLNFDFVVTDNLRQIQMIVTDTGVSVSGSARKLLTNGERIEDRKEKESVDSSARKDPWPDIRSGLSLAGFVVSRPEIALPETVTCDESAARWNVWKNRGSRQLSLRANRLQIA